MAASLTNDAFGLDDQHDAITADTSAAEADLKARLSRKRTKTGCLTCRKRRIKCGEERPICKNCVKSKRHCDGYNQRVVFKPPTIDFRHLQNGAASITFQAGAMAMDAEAMSQAARYQELSGHQYQHLRPRPALPFDQCAPQIQPHDPQHPMAYPDQPYTAHVYPAIQGRPVHYAFPPEQQRHVWPTQDPQGQPLMLQTPIGFHAQQGLPEVGSVLDTNDYQLRAPPYTDVRAPTHSGAAFPAATVFVPDQSQHVVWPEMADQAMQPRQFVIEQSRVDPRVPVSVSVQSSQSSSTASEWQPTLPGSATLTQQSWGSASYTPRPELVRPIDFQPATAHTRQASFPESYSQHLLRRGTFVFTSPTTKTKRVVFLYFQSLYLSFLRIALRHNLRFTHGTFYS